MATYYPKTMSMSKNGDTYVYDAGNIHYGECGTGATTQIKSVSIPEIKSLTAGLCVRVKFAYAQDYNGQPKLQVNSLTAANIVRNGTTAAARYEWQAGEVLDFLYDGTNFIIAEGAVPTTAYYGGRVKLNSDINSTSTTEAATPSAVKTAYDNALADSKSKVGRILPIVTGSTNSSGYAISAGDYFESDSSICQASEAIAINDTVSGKYSILSIPVLNALNNNITALTEQVANVYNGKKIKTIAGVIRNEGNGWYAITEGNHAKINIDSLSVNGDGEIVFNYGFTAKKVISLFVVCDETFAELYDVGTSVNINNCTISVFRKPVSVGGYISYDGSSWDVSMSTFTSASFSSGDLQLNHADVFSDIDVAHRSIMNVSGRDCIAQAGRISGTYVKISFVDASGTKITTPNTSMKAFVERKSVRFKVDASTISSSSGNFWIYGIMEVD